MVSNNTLPVIAETNENASYEENETIINSSEFSVEENETTIDELKEEKGEEAEEELEEATKEEVEEESEEDENKDLENEETEELETATTESGNEEIEEETEVVDEETTTIEKEEDESYDIASDSEIEIIDEETTEIDETYDIASNSEIEEIKTEISEIETTIDDIDDINIASKSEIDLLLVDLATQSEIEIEHLKEKIYATGYISDDYEAPVAVSEIDFENAIFSASNIPTRYDSRQHKNSKTGLSYIPPVRDQNPLNTCWAFSAIAMFEASLRIRGLVKNETESNLSEAALAYYTYGLENITNDSSYIDSPGLEGHDYTKIQNGNFISRGGNTSAALFTASAYAGIVKENSDTSYSRLLQYKNKETQYSLNKKYAFKNNDFAIENAYFINKENSDIVKRKIMENGAVGISYCSARANANSYNDDDAYMHYYGDEYYYFTNKTSSNHAISIVGWDDTIPASRFFMDYNGKITQAKNPGGWLCRNSWGADWRLSNGGYFWMSYEEPSLQYTMFAVDAMKSGVYKYNYHYDTTGNVETEYIFTSSNEHAAFGNIFKVPDNENHLLEATSIAISSSNTILTIEVYVNNKKMNNPTDGTLKSTVTVERETAGIFTIPLEDKVLLSKGSYFSIVVRGYSTNSNALNIFCDCTMTYAGMGANKGNPVHFYNSADYGQSFSATYKKDNNSYLYWSDLNYRLFTNSDYPNEYFGYNYRIKGLANPVEAIAKVSFDSNGGIGTMNDYNVLLNTDTKLIYNSFYKEGYTFSHWVDKNGNEYINEGIINVNSDLSLKAVWTPIEYTITYNVDGGTISENSVKKTYGKNIVLETPTKPGYVFLGWYKEASLTNLYDGNSDISIFQNDSVTIYAKWGIDNYTIVYDLNGVNATKPEKITKKFLKDVILSEPTNIPSGYSFVGWYKDSGFKNIYNGKEDLTSLSNDVVSIYAKWLAKLTYNSNGKGVAPNPVDVVKGGVVLLPSISNVKGYTFAGWYKDKNCNTKINDAGNYYIVSTPDTIYAKWNPDVYKITLNSKGGTIIEGGIKEYTYGIGATLPTNVKSPVEGEVFVGWYDNADLNGNKISVIDKNSTGNKTFYAKYSKTNSTTPIPEKPKPVTPSPITSNSNKGSSGSGGTGGSGGSGGSSGGGGGNGGGSGRIVGEASVTSKVLLYNSEKISTPEKNHTQDLNSKERIGISVDRSVTYIYKNSSAEWVSNETNGKWKLNIKDDNGETIRPAYGFIQLDDIKTFKENNEEKQLLTSDTYFFDENGDMVTGWVQTYADKWYYFNTEVNSEIGKMAFGWKEIDGSWYYFALEGALYRDTTTPDGYKVDENGKWIQ